MFLTDDTMLNENGVTLIDGLVFNICWKGEMSQSEIIKEAFFK